MEHHATVEFSPKGGWRLWQFVADGFAAGLLICPISYEYTKIGHLLGIWICNDMHMGMSNIVKRF